MDKLMKVSDFAERIDVPVSTAYRIVAAGHIVTIDIAAGTGKKKRIRITEAAYRKYLAVREMKAIGRGSAA